MHFHYLQHVDFEDIGSIAAYIEENGHTVASTKFFESNFTFPSIDSFDVLVVMGGPMGVYDENIYHWLADEKRFIANAIKNGKKVLGICLGSQLIAEVLGAKVFPNIEKEIGWFPVSKIDNEYSTILKDFSTDQIVFHWHGDTFDLPSGSILLASTNVCKNQAFVYNQTVIGLQFHLEVTPQSVKNMIDNGRNELKTANFIQTENEILAENSYFEGNQKLMNTILDYLVNAKSII